jgi:hypothetical protein
VELSKLYDGLPPEQRRELMTAWSRDPRLAASAGDFLLTRTKDSDPQIAIAAFTALQRLNGRNPPLGLPEAFARLNDKDPKVAAAARAMVEDGIDYRDNFGERSFAWLLPPRYSDHAYEDPEHPRLPSTAQGIADLLASAATAPAAEKERVFQVMVGIDDPRVTATLQEAARSKDRATRWAALDALVRRGDQSDVVLDHALSRLLTTSPDLLDNVSWPLVTARLRDRLNTFSGIADAQAVARVRASLERRLVALAALEPAR